MKIERVGKGEYFADYRDIHGTRKRITIQADRRSAALRIAKQWASNPEQAPFNKPSVSQGMRLSEAFRLAERQHYAGSKNQRHVSTSMNQLVEWTGDVEIISIDETVADELVMQLKEEGLTAGTINRKLAVLSKTLRLAMRWKHNGKPALQRVPDIPRQRESSGRIRVLTPEESKSMDEFFQGLGAEYYEFFVALNDTGCRVSEMLGAFIGPPDMDIVRARRLRHMNSYSSIDLKDEYIRVWDAKGGKPRSVPLTARLLELLKVKPEGLAFPGMSPSQVRVAWAKFRKHMKLEDDTEFTPHALRHSCATRLLQATSDIYLVKEWLGHADVTTTQRYAHMSSDRLEAGRDALQVLMQNGQ